MRLLDLIGIIPFMYLIFSCFSSLCDARSSFSLGSTWDVPQPEVDRASSIALYIKNLAVLRAWERAENYYGVETTVLRILLCAGGDGDAYAISFYIGHGQREVYQNGIHYYTLDDGGSQTYDFLVYSYTNAQRTRFAYIWSCWQAERIGGLYDNTGYGPYGMPHAWLHTTNLSQDGYINPDESNCAFIGWTGEAPFLICQVRGVNDAGYYFLLHFYSSALYHQNSLRAALDDASRALWHCDFSQSPFYTGEDVPSRMILYGDGNLVLP